MFSHVMLGADDIEASRKFYDAVLGTLGIDPGATDALGRVWWRNGKGILGLTRPIDGKPASISNGATLGFAAADQAAVDAFHAAGLANGGTAVEDPPGVRDNGFGPLYLAYLRDPAGNKICAMYRVR